MSGKLNLGPSVVFKSTPDLPPEDTCRAKSIGCFKPGAASSHYVVERENSVSGEKHHERST
jgi:hypothetical protein